MRRRLFGNGGGVIPLEQTQAGDYLLYDKSNQNLFFVSHQATLEQLQAYPLELYDYIGVVYIPASHDVYGDGSCCVCLHNGIFDMSSYIFGPEGVDIPGINFFNKMPYSGNRDNVGDEHGSLIGIAKWGYLPSDFYPIADYVDDLIQCPHDLNAYYPQRQNYYSPSPYLTDGSRNPSYYQTSLPSSEQNCLSDFDGIGNTKKILESGSTYEEYEAAYSCYKLSGSYHEEMCQIIQEGDFYLPSAGELGYLLARKRIVDDSTTNIYRIYNPNTSFGGKMSVYMTNWNYWTSTEYSADQVVQINPTWGNLSYQDKEYVGTPTSVVPSIRINTNGIVRI